MPEICRFYGIVVTMYAADDQPRSDLRDDWVRARAGERLRPIEPLR
jgi:hypothetical protein